MVLIDIFAISYALQSLLRISIILFEIHNSKCDKWLSLKDDCDCSSQ